MSNDALVSADEAREILDGATLGRAASDAYRTVIAQAEELAENATELERLRSLLDAEEMRQHASDPKAHAHLTAENTRLDEMRRLVFARNADLTAELARVTAERDDMLDRLAGSEAARADLLGIAKAATDTSGAAIAQRDSAREAEIALTKALTLAEADAHTLRFDVSLLTDERDAARADVAMLRERSREAAVTIDALRAEAERYREAFAREYALLREVRDFAADAVARSISAKATEAPDER